MSELEGSDYQVMMTQAMPSENVTSALSSTIGGCAGSPLCINTNVIHRFSQKYSLIKGEKYFVIHPDGSTCSGIILSRNDPRLANIKLDFQQTPMDVEECLPQLQPVDRYMDSKVLAEEDAPILPSVPMMTAQSPVSKSPISTVTSAPVVHSSLPATAPMTFLSSTASLPPLPSPTPECSIAMSSPLSKTNLRYHPYQRKRSASWTSSDLSGESKIGLTVRKLSAQFTAELSSMTSDPLVPPRSSCLSTLFSTVPSCCFTSMPQQTAASTVMSPSRSSDLERFEAAAISPLNDALDGQSHTSTRLHEPETSPLLHSSSSPSLSSSPSFSLKRSLLSQPLPTSTSSLTQSPTLNRSLELSVMPSLTLPFVSQCSPSMSRSASPLSLSSLPLSPKQPQNEAALIYTETSEILTPETKVLESVNLDSSVPLLTSSGLSPNEFAASTCHTDGDETIPYSVASSAILNEPEKVDDSETNALEAMLQCSPGNISTSSPSPSSFQVFPSTSLSKQSSPMLATESMITEAPAEPMDMSETLPTASSSTTSCRSPSPPRTMSSVSPTLLLNTPQSEDTVDDEKMDVSETGASSQVEPLPLLSSISSHTTFAVPSSPSSSSPVSPKSLLFPEATVITAQSNNASQILKKLALTVLNESSPIRSRPTSPRPTALSLLSGLSPSSSATEVQSSESTQLSVSSLSEEQEMTSVTSGNDEAKKLVQKKTEDVVQILSSDDEDESKSPGKRHKTLSTDEATKFKNNNGTAIETKNSNNSTVNNDNTSHLVAVRNDSGSDDKATIKIDPSTVLVAVHLRQTLFGMDRNATYKQCLVFIDRLILYSGVSESLIIPLTEVSAMYLHHGLSGPVFFLLLSDKFSLKLQQLLSICPTKFNPESSDLGSRYVTLIPSKRNAQFPQMCDRKHVDSRLSLVKSYLETKFNHQVHLEMISGDRTSEILQAALILPETQMAHTASCPDLRSNAQVTPPPPSTPGIVVETETIDVSSQNQTPSNSGGTALTVTNGNSSSVGILAINGNGIGTAANVVTPKGSFILVTRNFRQLLQPVGNKGGSSPTVFRFTTLPKTEPVAIQAPPRAPFNQSIVTLFTYPPSPGPGRMSITNEDFYCLNDGEFLNDAIIDFYLKYILLEKIDAETCSRVHVFSSFFYGKLSDKVPEESSQNSGPTSQQIRHSRVKTWTRHVDIFSKDFLVVPINENAHWFLAIVCFPGLSGPIIEQLPTEDKYDANNPDNGGTEKIQSFPKLRLRQPCILIFDSLGLANHFLVIKTLREYLQVEWDTRKLTIEGEREFSEQSVPGSSPRCPLQTNTSDCGVYLLQYVESFFLNPIVDFAMPIQNTANWFPQELVRGKRKMLQNLIIQLKEKLNQTVSSPAVAAGSDQQAT